MSNEGDEGQLLEAWLTNHRINMRILEGLDVEALACTLSTRGGRDVARQFAHIHDVRRYQLENRRARDLAEPLRKFASKGGPRASPTGGELVSAHEASTEAVGTFLLQAHRGEENRRPFRKGLFTTLSYLIAHESHHRGSILLTLKQCGHGLDRATASGIWDWDRM